jgi:hypothetical protein
MDLRLTLHLDRGPDLSRATFEINSAIRREWWWHLDAIGAKSNDHFEVTIGRPFRPRKTGYRSGSARLHGHCHDLAEQMAKESQNVGKLAERIKAAMKRMTAGEGLWRTFLDIDGTEQPISEAEASVEEESAINRILQRFADEHGFWLTEFIDKEKPELGTYRSIGGRSQKEMEALIEQER